MTEATKTPWHLWVVGVVGVLWNGFGAFDFISTVTRGEAYLRESGYDQVAIDYFNAMPGWMYGPWVLGIFGGLIGAVLLLLRQRWAVPALGLSLLGAVISLLYGMVIDPAPPPPPEMAMMTWMPWVIVLIAAAFAAYGWWMRKAGVLR